MSIITIIIETEIQFHEVRKNIDGTAGICNIIMVYVLRFCIETLPKRS